MVDLNFKLIVAAIAAVLVGLLTFLRFCGELSLPPKPPPPAATSLGRASDIMSETSGTPAAWRASLAKDAEQAGLPAPDPDELARAFPFQLDAKPRTLAIGDSMQAAGLELTLSVLTDPDTGEKSVILEIENLGRSELAYQVVTRPGVNPAACHRRRILVHDAMVLGARARERRSECGYRDDIEIYVDRVETVELPRLSAWYVSRVPPSAVSLDTRLHKGHKPSSGAAPCNVLMSQAIRGGLEAGTIEWRDLVDFFARHRCDTYQFPQGYKAFKRDRERPLPAM
jgi:hypothetical protein